MVRNVEAKSAGKGEGGRRIRKGERREAGTGI